MEENADIKFKLLLVGDGDVGKSEILNKFLPDNAAGSVDFKLHSLTYNGKQINLQIWDTAGQERFRAITSSYYRGAHGAMVVFDVTNRDSYDHVSDWFKDIDRYCEPNIAKALVGHLDFKSGEREVSEREAEESAYNGGYPYFEVKSNTNENNNVEAAFMGLIKEAYETFNKQEKEEVELISPTPAPKPKKKCSV